MIFLSLQNFYQKILGNKYFISNFSFDETEKLWVWNFEGNLIYLDLDEIVRVKVCNDKFTQICPTPPNNNIQNKENMEEEKEDGEINKTYPYMIIGSFAEQGLGCVRWWNED